MLFFHLRQPGEIVMNESSNTNVCTFEPALLFVAFQLILGIAQAVHANYAYSTDKQCWVVPKVTTKLH
jgi:hypothetical protein